MNGQQFLDIAIWQNETFGKANALSKIVHLTDELSELMDDLLSKSPEEVTRLGYADCFILLFGSAASYGMSYEQICNAIEEKMQINYKRQWGEPDINGVSKHMRL